MPELRKNSRYPLSSEELSLIAGCIAQERNAQRRLYEKYKDAMYTLAYRITGDFALAEDVLQEAFLGVFTGIERFRKESSLGAWIKAIVVRKAYRKLKRQPLQHELPIDDKLSDKPIDWGHPLDIEYLDQAIQALPAGYRSVFLLIEKEGYSHKEVAEMLGISVGTSKSQLYHAKKQLKKRLQRFHYS